MTKIVVVYGESPYAICDSIADAEELILSIAEENLYENWFRNNCCYKDTEFVEPSAYVGVPFYVRNKYYTKCGYALSYSISHFEFWEVEEI